MRSLRGLFRSLRSTPTIKTNNLPAKWNTRFLETAVFTETAAGCIAQLNDSDSAYRVLITSLLDVGEIQASLVSVPQIHHPGERDGAYATVLAEMVRTDAIDGAREIATQISGSIARAYAYMAIGEKTGESRDFEAARDSLERIESIEERTAQLTGVHVFGDEAASRTVVHAMSFVEKLRGQTPYAKVYARLGRVTGNERYFRIALALCERGDGYFTDRGFTSIVGDMARSGRINPARELASKIEVYPAQLNARMAIAAMTHHPDDLEEIVRVFAAYSRWLADQEENWDYNVQHSTSTHMWHSYLDFIENVLTYLVAERYFEGAQKILEAFRAACCRLSRGIFYDDILRKGQVAYYLDLDDIGKAREVAASIEKAEDKVKAYLAIAQVSQKSADVAIARSIAQKSSDPISWANLFRFTANERDLEAGRRALFALSTPVVLALNVRSLSHLEFAKITRTVEDMHATLHAVDNHLASRVQDGGRSEIIEYLRSYAYREVARTMARAGYLKEAWDTTRHISDPGEIFNSLVTIFVCGRYS